MKFVKEGPILHLIYDDHRDLPAEFCSACDAYEGSIKGRVGWNVPATMVKTHNPKSPLLKYKAEYIIAYKKGDIQAKRHELQHARFYLDKDYQQEVRQLWNSFSASFQQSVTTLLQKMKYPNDPHILLDEFQAYYFTEKPHFFGKQT
jgi:hypothetical protein